MADQFVAEIRIFPFNFPPTGWATCDGQILAISQNTALFSLLGTNYGGDGKSNFGLPNLQGSVPLHAGSGGGPGLTPFFVGETGGVETVTLLQTEMPQHSHNLMAAAIPANLKTPAAGVALSRTGGGSTYTNSANLGAMNPATLTTVGGNLPHNNLMPYLVLTFCIALQGIFPPRA
jgi:microcystin-dependent protein